MKEYDRSIERLMCTHYFNLSKKDKRHYAAVEAAKLGHGGISYIAELFGCCRQTITLGLEELKKDMIDVALVRQEIGGRIASDEKFENIDEVFLLVILEHIAGDPMDENIRWVKLTHYQISIAMKKLGISASRNIIRKLLKKHDLVKRKMQKKKSTGTFKDRDTQFKNIEKIKSEYMASNNPVLSIDTKKKEAIGNLYRSGTVYCTQALESCDHDYPYLSEGTVVSHEIYDFKQNTVFINIGLEHETAEFICDSVKKWWNKIGKEIYHRATEILIFCDAAGANSYRHHVFKLALQNLANAIGLSIRICHYPPYTSKWNPIEHRVFPHVTRAMDEIKIESIESAKNLIKQNKTKTDLKVIVNFTKKIYSDGIKVAKEVFEKINITQHVKLGQLNYAVGPVT